MTDRKFTTLRRRLDQLGYRQPLVLESVPLVEKLFSDLVHTTESFKNYKQKTKYVDKGITDTDQSEPFRNDNAKLVRENNELHIQLIKSKEEIERLTSEMKSIVRKFQHENQDLKFLNSQYVHKIRALEKESKQKNNHIQSLEERNMNAVIETPGGRSKNIPFRRQRMDMTSTLSHNESVSSNKTQCTDPYVADLLGMADSRVEDFQKHIAKLESGYENHEQKNRHLKKQIESRDKEILRLTEMLHGGRPVEAVLKDSKRGSSDRVVGHLNIQVDYLQQANRDLENQLSHHLKTQSEATETVKNLKECNDELCMELAAIDKMYKNIEKEKVKGDEEIDKQLAALHSEVEEKQQNILDLQANNYNTKKERDDFIEEIDQLTHTIKSLEEDKISLTQMYERFEKEKRRLQEKNAKLTVSERELVMDLERLKISKGVISKKTQSPDRMEFLVRNLEDDRDHFRKECDILQEIIHKRLFSKTHKIDNKLQENHAMTQLMKEERDYYKKEFELLRSCKNNTKLSSPPTRDKPSQQINEVSRLRRERDELQNMLESFEKHLAQIQENVKVVTTDRDNIQLLYEQSNAEIQRMRRQVSRSQQSTTSRKITSILEKAEKERDEAISELRKARLDIQSLRENVQLIQDKHMSEKQQQITKEHNVEDLMTKLESDNDNLGTRISSTQNMIRSLEEQLSSANKIVRQSNETVAEKEAEVARLRLLLGQSDRTNSELRQKYEDKTIEVEKQGELNIKLEAKCDSMDKTIISYKNEISRLKGIVSSLDQERDALQQQVDEKAEQLVHLDDDLRQQEKADSDLKLNVEELEETLRYQKQELSSREREINSLSKQLRSIEEELAAVSRSRDITVKENKHVQDDLATMTVENQVVHKELQEVLDESHHLKEQIEEYVLQLKRVEHLLAQKELEKEDILLQYKTLSSKADVLESNIQQTEDNANVCKQDLLHRQQEMNYLQDRCAALQEEVEQHITNEESYEKQITKLTQSISNLETQLQVCNEEKETILDDLFAVRELCVKLDKAREEAMRKVTVQSNNQEQMELLLKETQIESEMVKKQVLQEKENIKSLENVISAGREKQFYEKHSLEEGLLDLERVKGELVSCRRDKQHKETEVQNLRKQNLTLHDEVTSLRKQLTSEKFERERINQELRRQSPTSLTKIRKSTDRRSSELAVTTTTDGQNILRGSYLSTSKHSPLLSPAVHSSFSPLHVSFSSDDNDETK